MPSATLPREQLLTEATEWFVRLQDAQENPALREEFSAWLLRSPAHIGAFLEVARAWGDVGLIGDDLPATDDLVRAARASSEETPSNVVVLHTRKSAPEEARRPEPEPAPARDFGRADSPPSSCSRRRWFLFSAAATAALATVALGWLAIDHLILNPTHIRTAIGEQRSVALADGSVVQLNTNSELRIDLAENQRRILLERGEARFTVAKDKSRPFLVVTPQATVRALGTVFNVQIAPQGNTDVAVFEGRVEVSTQKARAGETANVPAPPDSGANADARTSSKTSGEQGSALPEPLELNIDVPEPVILLAGEQAAVTQDGEILEDVGPPIERVRSWTDRRLVFREETLETLVAEVNRYHEHPIRIGDPQVAALKISGTFAAHDLPSLIEYLERYRGVDAQEQPDGSILLKAAASAQSDE